MTLDKTLQILDSENGWPFIETRLDTIMAIPADNKIDVRTFITTYTAIHDRCCEIVSQVSHGALREVYQRLKMYLTKRLDSVCAKVNENSGEALLACYIKEWKQYTTSAKYISHVSKYVDRCYVNNGVEESKPYDTYTLHFALWKEVVFVPTQSRVLDAVLQLVEMQRNGETVELSLVKEVIDSFVSLGLDAEDSESTSLEVYHSYFELPFLKATEEYYKKESGHLLASESVDQVVRYAEKVKIRLDQEKERVMPYLHNSTMAPLMAACRNVLIEQHSRTLSRTLSELRSNERQVNKLLAQIPDDHSEESDVQVKGT